jgi:outer membrane receptor protein involved in Fe transport
MRKVESVFKALAFVLCVAAFSINVAAQTATTGTIEGTVLDSLGNAVPGVTVRVTSPNLITPQSATTNDEGRYRILNLPPGRYTVAVEAAKGFAEFKQENVEVNLSRTSTVAVTLQPQSAQASVTVTDTSGGAVDVTASTTGTNVSTEQFSNFPTQRTVQSLYNIAPTAARSGLRDASGRDRDPSISGSSGPENNYILDGINTTDPAYGGSGANLPFEFVQEVEIKTGAYGAEYGKSTGGIFNVITKSGGNDVRGDAFAYFTTKGFVRETKHFPFTGLAQNGFSELDAGFDIGGPIRKDKIWFFGAFNPQRRKNFFLGQTLRTPFQNTVTTPFYAGKITWAVNQRNVLTFSTFGDYTKSEGLAFQGIAPQLEINGFGAHPNSFLGQLETGGSNYTARLNSTITQNMIGEFAFGLHRQRFNIIPEVADVPFTVDNFAILRGDNSIAPVTDTSINFPGFINPATGASSGAGFISYAYSPNGSLQRNFLRNGFAALFNQNEKRNRDEFAARLQNIWGPHTIKYGFEWNRNKYNISRTSTGHGVTFGNPLGLRDANGQTGNNSVNGYRVTNSYAVCTTRGSQIVCSNPTAVAIAQALVAAGGAPAGLTSVVQGTPTTTEANNNPFLIRLSTRIRDFALVANDAYTNVESFYIQDDYKISRTVQINAGLRWDYQQAGIEGARYISFNSFMDNLQPRIGLIYDFTGKGKGKLFVNYARFVEAPIPLDVNVRAGGNTAQTDKQFNVNRLNGPPTATVVPGINGDPTIGFGNFGATATPVDPDIKPQTVNEATAGIEYEIVKDLALGGRAIYRTQGSVIEDGSFDNGVNYFLFNPGESLTDRLAETFTGARFGRARRYYRALEVTATKRFANNYQFIASYVFSSLIGNYEGIFRNDNGQADPNITSLFDLVALLNNTYGRLPNDRPHQFKFNGSYQTPFKLLVSTNFYIQSGIPFNQLIPGVPPYGNNEGFAVPRGTAVIPANVISTQGGVQSGRSRTPTTYQLDFGAYYPIQLGENRQLRLQLDWFNVTNAQRAVRLDETFAVTSNITGIPPVPNPFYGAGSLFQFPSALRLGVKFQF